MRKPISAAFGKIRGLVQKSRNAQLKRRHGKVTAKSFHKDLGDILLGSPFHKTLLRVAAKGGKPGVIRFLLKRKFEILDFHLLSDEIDFWGEDGVRHHLDWTDLGL